MFPFAIIGRVVPFWRSALDPVCVVPFTVVAPPPILMPFRSASKYGALPPALVMLNASSNVCPAALDWMLTTFRFLPPNRPVPLLPTYAALNVSEFVTARWISKLKFWMYGAERFVE